MATQITTSLQPLNPFPHRLTVTEDEMVTQGEAFFDQLQQDFQPELSDIIDEMNAVTTEVNINAINTENNAILANGLANFKGAWSGVTTYGKGESVESTLGSQIYYISKVAGNLNHVVTDTNYWLYSPINNKLDKDFSILTNKATPIDTDIFPLREVGGLFKKLTWANVKATILASFGVMINTATEKTTLANNDILIIGDSADSNASKKLTFENLKATLLTYFDTFYSRTTAIFGIGQTWQNVTASRIGGITYTNSTGKPIEVSIRVGNSTAAATVASTLLVNSDQIAAFDVNDNSGSIITMTATVPNNTTYAISVISGSLSSWYELR